MVPVSLTRTDGRVVFGEMSQPVPTWTPFDRAAEVLAAVGVERYLSLPRGGLVRQRAAPRVCVPLPDEASVSALAPDIAALGRLGPVGVSCFATSAGRVKTRMFGPGLGMAEDPATGSAAGPLAVHLARHGVIGFGERIEIHQGAEIGRPSTLFAQADGTAERVERVRVGGSACVVAHGEYRLD